MELWTGLVCLVANPAGKHFKRFGDGKGAYVNVVAWAESASHFEGRVTLAAERLDCIVREMEQIEWLEALFVAEYMYGAIQPDDDIEELRWFGLNRTLEVEHIVDAHRPLLVTLMDRVEKREGKQLEERATYELPAQNR